jgi:hypothetical protein
VAEQCHYTEDEDIERILRARSSQMPGVKTFWKAGEHNSLSPRISGGISMLPGRTPTQPERKQLAGQRPHRIRMLWMSWERLLA